MIISSCNDFCGILVNYILTFVSSKIFMLLNIFKIICLKFKKQTNKKTKQKHKMSLQPNISHTEAINVQTSIALQHFT